MTIIEQAELLFAELKLLPQDELINTINSIRSELHNYSPFKNEPIDFIQWVPCDLITANDYNPNKVAPPEMVLLEHSIREDGYTQPIVAWGDNSHYEVVDGFHRTRVGKEIPDIHDRVHGYLPLVVINQERLDRGDRIASTIRHNRARGKHQINAMSDIIVELKKRCWSNEKIGRELGMDADEVLRLSQISGLAELFQNRDFSEAWEADTSDFEEIEPITE